MDSVSLGMSLVEITWLNILLSGDNALVIALACRSLEGRQRRLGIVFGAGAAVALRIIFTIGVSYILKLPFLRAGGAILLLWVAVKLLLGEEPGEDGIEAQSSIMKAVWTIVMADIVMSLDNVLAIAAAAHGSQLLIILGLVISVPIVVAGSSLIVNVLNRLPVLIWAGAGFLGWVAGEMFVADETAMSYLPVEPPEWIIPTVCALLVLGLGWMLSRRHESEDHSVAG